MSIIEQLNLKVEYKCCPYFGKIIDDVKWEITKEWLRKSEIKYVDIHIHPKYDDYSFIKNEYQTTYNINVPRKITFQDFVNKNDMIDKLDKSRNNTNIITSLVVCVKCMKRNVMLEIVNV